MTLNFLFRFGRSSLSTKLKNKIKKKNAKNLEIIKKCASLIGN